LKFPLLNPFPSCLKLSSLSQASPPEPAGDKFPWIRFPVLDWIYRGRLTPITLPPFPPGPVIPLSPNLIPLWGNLRSFVRFSRSEVFYSLWGSRPLFFNYAAGAPFPPSRKMLFPPPSPLNPFLADGSFATQMISPPAAFFFRPRSDFDTGSFRFLVLLPLSTTPLN